MASVLLLNVLAALILLRAFPVLPLAVLSSAYLLLSFGWERELPAFVRRRLRRSLLAIYYLGQLAIGLTWVALLLNNGLKVDGLAVAVLAGLHLGHFLMAKRSGNGLQASVVWHFTHTYSVVALALILASDRGTFVGAGAAALLAAIGLGARSISGKAIYEHFAALLAIIALTIGGRAGSVQLIEYYSTAPGLYLAWLFYKSTRGEPASEINHERVKEVGLAIAIMLCLVGIPAWQFAVSLAASHLLCLGLGAVLSVHLFLSRPHSQPLAYIACGVLLAEAIYLTFWGRPTSIHLIAFAVIGLLILGRIIPSTTSAAKSE
jgi:hypothetical protein